MACYAHCAGFSTSGSKLGGGFCALCSLSSIMSEGQMRWVERCYPDLDDRMREDMIRVKGGVDMFVATISSRKVWLNINAFRKARMLNEYVESVRVKSKDSWVFSYKHMVIDLQLADPGILAGTEAGRILNRCRRRRYGEGKKCCCVLAFARPLARGVGRIDLG